MQRHLYINFSILSLLAFLHCTQPKFKSGYEEIKDRAVWVKPKYSGLFLIGTYSGDTFLILKDPADTSRELGAWCWGIGSGTYTNIRRLNANVPVVITSAVFAGMLESLHAENRIIGIDNGDYLSSPRTSKRYAAGKIVNVAKSGEVSAETVARLKYCLLIGYFIDQKGRESLLRLQAENRPVLFFQNFLETHPLGRAEWIKVFGYLCGKPEEAEKQFAEIEEHYLTLSEKAEALEQKPTVLINAPFSGTWDIPAGESYMARLMKDAGGTYIWAEDKGMGRLPLDIEKVYTRANAADFWLNPGACRDYACLQSQDARLSKFQAFRKQQVFNCTRTLNAKGGNAYWEYGVLRPDLVLADLIRIFHPDLLEDEPLVFFEPLKKS